MSNTEESFIKQLNQKQRSAYHRLFNEFYRSLVLYAMKYVGQQEEAEDIVQDLFVAVWEKDENFLSYHSFRVFLYNSVRNTCLNRIKHRKVEEKYIDYSVNQGETDDTPDWELMEDELYRQLFRCVEELPSRCREIFILHLDGKKNEEIARELHLSILTVKTQKKNALRYLRDRLGHFCLIMIYFYSH